ncbi:SLATT domain-containing protein [Sphingomonas hylomeconis]|uniref:SLATT domain-containing protein n=1 Tax=Sphingomonas hylomeconis TaxID=1395958 RepID=A0ABV7SVH7_9SPHN|nr:SLATT domain-containing protein [Sphingomonas hylomeconis]
MTPGEKLLWDMKVTAGARFNAATRLSAKDRFGNVSISIYSSIVVSTSIVGLAFDLGATSTKIIGVATLIASIVILVLSMKLFADRHAVDAEQMHRCALEINELRRHYLATGFSGSSDLVSASEKYNALLQKFSINHSESDYSKYKYAHRWEFDDLRELDDKSARKREISQTRPSNSLEKITAALGGAGLAAAIGGLLAAMLGL